MKAALLIGFLVLAPFIVLQAIANQKDEAILDQSFRLSQDLGGREQLSYLIDLCHVSERLNLPTERLKEYSNVLFRLASAEQDMEWQIIGQKNAVACLSYADPLEAMDLLLKINFQHPKPGEWLYQDPRYNAAEKTFVNFFSFAKSKSQAVDAITVKARHLGQTGQYPYFAVAKFISGLPASSTSQANTLLSDALGFYAAETGFYNRDEEFLLLLESLKNRQVDKYLTARAVTTFVQHLKNDPTHLPGDYYAEVRIISTGKVFPFTDRNEAFLFQAFPQINRFDPVLAAQLRQRDPKLTEATEKMKYISGGFVQGDPTSEKAKQQHLHWLQESLVSRIKDCQSSNPQLVVRLAQRLADPSSRIAGLSAAIQGLAKQDRPEARRLYKEQHSILNNMRDPLGNLRATVALIPAAYYLGDSEEYASLSTQAFASGLQLFNGDTGAQRVGRHKAIDELRDLIGFTASQPSDVLKIQVQQLQDSWLKAYLLLYEAEGRAKLKAPPTAWGACPD